MPKLKIDLNIAAAQEDNIHGFSKKHGVVLHETISPNYPGLRDIISVSEFLDNKDYGIHSITDADGNIAHAKGLGEAIFYHTASSGYHGNGRANTFTVGIEQISRVPLDYSDNYSRWMAWLRLNKELNATAKLIACLARAHDFPLELNQGDTRKPGIATHWEVSTYFGVDGGHVDCFPHHRGGYYPLLKVQSMAKGYYSRGWHF
jgi:hypothetical protein